MDPPYWGICVFTHVIVDTYCIVLSPISFVYTRWRDPTGDDVFPFMCLFQIIIKGFNCVLQGHPTMHEFVLFVTHSSATMLNFVKCLHVAKVVPFVYHCEKN